MPDTRDLRERAKELRCLYTVHDILRERHQSPVQAFSRIVEAIPAGWQRPQTAGSRIEYLGRSYVGPGFCSSSPILSEPIRVWGTEFGRVQVSDTATPDAEADPMFLPDEIALLRNVATRLGEYLEWKQTELLVGRAPSADHAGWRERYVQALGTHLDAERFGVRALYVGGSTESGDAGPGSDIDLFVVFAGTEERRRELSAWLDGWNRCLAEIAAQQTGYVFSRGLLDVHWLDDEPESRRTDLRQVPLGGGAG